MPWGGSTIVKNYKYTFIFICHDDINVIDIRAISKTKYLLGSKLDLIRINQVYGAFRPERLSFA